MPEIHTLNSEILGRRRKVRVFLPGQYEREAAPPLPLIVQADGQLAFSDRDDALPFGSWQLDRQLQQLADEGTIRPAVVVGVDNSPQRMKEYFPVTEEYERYAHFVLKELLPWVREHYRVSAEQQDNFVMGSSMGGLVSFALAASHHDVFGGAGCLSPWFEHEQGRYIREVLRPMKKKPAIRVYMDSGIRDWRMLDDGHRAMLQARLELLRLGFEEGKDLEWQVDTFFPTEADLEETPVKPDKRSIPLWNQHTEFHFARRCGTALRFLLGKRA